MHRRPSCSLQPPSEKKEVPGSSVLLSPQIVQSGLFMSIIMYLIPFTLQERTYFSEECESTTNRVQEDTS